MDQESEVRRFKWILGSAAMFLLSGCYSYDELKYAMFGKHVDAHVLQKNEFNDARLRGPNVRMIAVKYQFAEAGGGIRSERDNVPLDWPFTAGDTVRVQYIPGVPDRSRLAGNNNLFPVAIFTVCLVLLGVSAFKLWREATDTGGRGKARSRRA